jgi:hypothetical protein
MPEALLPSADKLFKRLFIALLAFYYKQLIVYLVPALFHNSIIQVGSATLNVPFFSKIPFF